MYSKIDQIIILLLLICHLIYIKLYSIYLYGNNPILVYRIKKSDVLMVFCTTCKNKNIFFLRDL